MKINTAELIKMANQQMEQSDDYEDEISVTTDEIPNKSDIAEPLNAEEHDKDIEMPKQHVPENEFNHSSYFDNDFNVQDYMNDDISDYDEYSPDEDEEEVEVPPERFLTLPVARLITNGRHTFKTLPENKLAELAEDISENGIIEPLIVRPIPDSYDFEIISGHNRKLAAESIGLISAPCLVMYNLSEAQADLIMVSSNLMRRQSYLPSELAYSLKAAMDSIRSQGNRSDIFENVNKLINENGNCEQLTEPDKISSHEYLAGKYSMSSRQIARFIRLTHLFPSLLDMVDEKKIPFVAAIHLSYLSNEQQKILLNAFNKGSINLDVKNCEAVKKLCLNNKIITEEQIINIVPSKSKSTVKTGSKVIPIKAERLSKFFPDTVRPDEIEEVVITALKMYFSKDK